jgi:hypothetical protein
MTLVIFLDASEWQFLLSGLYADYLFYFFLYFWISVSFIALQDTIDHCGPRPPAFMTINPTSRHLLTLLGRNISSSQALYLNRTLQNTGKKHRSVPERNSKSRRQEKLRPRGHFHRQFITLYNHRMICTHLIFIIYLYFHNSSIYFINQIL